MHMKKAVINTGGKQYLVTEGQSLSVEVITLPKDDTKKIQLQPLMLIDDEAISIGHPTLEDNKVEIEIVEPLLKADKVVAIRNKAKKRVHKVHGHRQSQTLIKIVKIS
jgi:large subunit ribosomal protein L21